MRKQTRLIGWMKETLQGRKGSEVEEGRGKGLRAKLVLGEGEVFESTGAVGEVRQDTSHIRILQRTSKTQTMTTI